MATARAAAGATGLEDAGLPEISSPGQAAEQPAQARAEASEAGPSQVQLQHTAHVAGSLARPTPAIMLSPGKLLTQCMGVLQQASTAYEAVKNRAAAAGQPALEALSHHVGEPALRRLQSLASSTRSIAGALQGSLTSFSPSRAAAAATQQAEEQQRGGSPAAAGGAQAAPPSPLRLLIQLGPNGLQAFQRMQEGARTDRRSEPAALGGAGRASRGSAPAGPDRPPVSGQEQAPHVQPFQRTRAPSGAKRKTWDQQLGRPASAEDPAGPGPGAAAAAAGAMPVLRQHKPKRARQLVLADEVPWPLAAGGVLQLTGPALAGPAQAGPAMAGPALAGPAMPGPAMPGPAMVPLPPIPNPLAAGFAAVLNGMTDMRAAVALFWQLPTPDQKVAVFVCLRRELREAIAPDAMAPQR